MDPLLSAAHAMRDWFVAVRVNAGPWVGPPPIRQLKRVLAFVPSYSFQRLTRTNADGEAACRILLTLRDVMGQTPIFNKTNEGKLAIRACGDACQRILTELHRKSLDYGSRAAILRTGVWYSDQRPRIHWNRPHVRAYVQAWCDMRAQRLIDQMELVRWSLRHRAFEDLYTRMTVYRLEAFVEEAREAEANLRFVGIGSGRTALETLRLLIEETPSHMRAPLRRAEAQLDGCTPLLSEHRLVAMQGFHTRTSPLHTLPEEILRTLLHSGLGI